MIKPYTKHILIAIIAVVAIIVIVIQMGSKDETISQGHTEQTTNSHTELHISDSIALYALQVKYDSLYSATRVVQTDEQSTTDEKRGVIHITDIVEKTNSDGSTERRTTITKIDTSKIISIHIKTILDSMATLIETKIDSAKATVVATHDTVYKHDTTATIIRDTIYRHTTTNPRKLALAAQLGGVASGEPNVLPMIDIDARYTVLGPVFIDGGLGFVGLNYLNSTNYKVHVGVGMKLEF